MRSTWNSASGSRANAASRFALLATVVIAVLTLRPIALEAQDDPRRDSTAPGHKAKGRGGPHASEASSWPAMARSADKASRVSGATGIAYLPLATHKSGHPTAPGPMREARHGHTATLLADGRILIVGGVGFVRTAEIYDPLAGSWNRTMQPDIARSDHTATRLLDGRVLLVGGTVRMGPRASPTDIAEIYDPDDESWSRATSVPTAVSGHVAVLLHDGSVLVVGGSSDAGPTVAAWAYNPTTDAWAATTTAKQKGAVGTATVLRDGRVLVVGGWHGSRPSDRCEIFDPRANTWSETGDLSSPRGRHTATLLTDGEVLVTGLHGRSGHMAEMFDPAAGTWEVMPEPALRRFRHTATLLADGTVLIAGGRTDSGLAEISERFDPRTRSWHAAESLAWLRTDHTASALAGGVLVAGGDPGAWKLLSEVAPRLADYARFRETELFVPDSGRWWTASLVNPGRLSLTITALDDGRVLLAGGTGVGGAMAHAAVLDSRSMGWSATDPMGVARTAHSATRLPDGSVLVAGGANSYGPVAAAEIFDSTSSSWREAAPLAEARFGHSATSLPNGDVLVVGGDGGLSRYSHAVASSERYDADAGTWRSVGSLETPVCEHSATLLHDGTVLVTGGLRDCKPEGPVAASFRYDPVGDAWNQVADLPVPRHAHSATVLDDGRVLVHAGQVLDRYNSIDTRTAWLYDPGTDVWSDAEPALEYRVRHQTVVLGDGSVMAVGGKSGHATTSTVESYSPTSGTWSRGAPMATSRLAHALAMLPDGRLLVVGGAVYESELAHRQVLATVEVYDPSTEAWTIGPSLPAYR